MTPQPSGIVPQFFPCAAQVVAEQPHLPAPPPPPHVAGVRQVLPQSSKFPQVSDAGPHSTPSVAHVFGTHGTRPQRLGPSPPQLIPGPQALQSRTPPHPSGIIPQSAF
jgi:hypothetical protein